MQSVLDFQKAFDTVNHKILISKLNHYGVRRLSLDWFKSHLTNRQRKTLVKGIYIIWFSNSFIWYTTGVYIRPTSFFIYINNLNNAIAHSMVHHFADDTNITFLHKYYEYTHGMWVLFLCQLHVYS